MEVAVELEDDLFFADLSKQISLLIMDDDEDPVARCPSVCFQVFTNSMLFIHNKQHVLLHLLAFSGANYPIAQHSYLHDQICRRESKGTGVFIPRSSQPGRKHRQGRYSSFNTRSNRQHDKTRMVSQASYNSSFYPRKGSGYTPSSV
ncbi:PREDICTED: uncharacterized protein LOC18611680 isoform X1 [Theobroma cacao]|uniref:Uncharacterized protein LOC18611680 isoform X1 n=1 Tax=Theobroma cacao TaxID=3641 RepID=A0AB32VVZ7_THECC|nr:PREDICTED: uncharacterized protein LOC18611680 isoform X1 [Theobroma cacao]